MHLASESGEGGGIEVEVQGVEEVDVSDDLAKVISTLKEIKADIFVK